MGCKYCEQGYIIPVAKVLGNVRTPGQAPASIVKTYGIASLFAEGAMFSFDITINYCPMCGAALNQENKGDA